MGKHAYLIMAHNQIELLKKLLYCLDHERNDIFLHIDKKCIYDKLELTSCCFYSKIFFTHSISVHWGGYSQIAAELILLESAINTDKYDYYHLLTGVDLPLKTQTEVLNYFDQHKGIEFISLGKCTFMERVNFYYLFQDYFDRNNVLGHVLNNISIKLQKLLGIQRRSSNIRWGCGSAYFDITDDVARYVVKQKRYIKQRFKKTCCADEIFLQTIYLNSPFYEKKILNKYKGCQHKYIERTYLDINRAIDWTRGNPYVYSKEDFQILMDSGCLWARKFDIRNNKEIIEQIVERVVRKSLC